MTSHYVTAYKAIREDLAKVLGLTVEPIRYDPVGLTGKHAGRELSLYNFNIGRGGVYMRIEMDINNPANISLTVRGGLTGKLSKQIKNTSKKEYGSGFNQHFLVTGKPEQAIIKLLESPTIQEALLHAFNRRRGIEMKMADSKLSLEQLDHGDYDSQYLQRLIQMLTQFADSVERETNQ